MDNLHNIPLTLASISLAIGLLLFIFYRGKVILMFFQQEEYDGPRFMNWVVQKGAIDKRATSFVLLGLIIINFFPDFWYSLPIGLLIMTVGFAIGFFISKKYLKEAKKALVMTPRAKRIFILYFPLMLLTGYSLSYLMEGISIWGDFANALILLQGPPLFITLSNTLLSPLENWFKKGFVNEAKAKIKDLNPTIIGITGSYGKTSTKHILAHILSASNSTLATPGSVNTEMGICRIVRENLGPKHKYFIAEMGAYGKGSIDKLCQLTPPKFGIITGIGVAHYERFKSLETVFHAKFELADAVKEQNGFTLINKSTIPQGFLEPRLKSDKSLVTIATDPKDNAELKVTSIEEKRDGLHLDMKIKGETVVFFAPIYGLHQAGNIALSVACAIGLGYPISTIKASLKTLKQTRHRQEVTLGKTGPNIIDDAYNSNPTGFKAALDTLELLGKEGGKRILITPGMVELGAEHDAKHLEVGQYASSRVDVACIVTPDRIPTFVEGLEKGPSEIHKFETQEEAESFAKNLAQAGDTILFENNLPDLFESEVRF